jgi:hypothetical protein
VKDVLAVMQDNPHELGAFTLFVQQDRLDDPVQAVRLAGWTRVRHLHTDQVREPLPHSLDFIDRRCVIHVRPHKDDVIAIVERGDHVLEHRCDDSMLEPSWNHESHGLLIAVIQLSSG